MREFKPKFYDIVYVFIPENTNDIFINEKTLECYRTSETLWDRQGYEGLMLALGKTAFVFDVNACDFLGEERVPEDWISGDPYWKTNIKKKIEKHKHETPKHVLDSYYSCTYVEECKRCGVRQIIYTQKDDCSEFITSVGVLCKCGNIVWFQLPVH